MKHQIMFFWKNKKISPICHLLKILHRVLSIEQSVLLDGMTYYSSFETVTISMCASQGPVVQSIVSLTSSLSVISLTVLADSIYNILIFFAEKM